jgi:predicted TIM-barrel fold metal-dependent hydrolase
VTPIFDAHFHIIDSRFPLVPNQGYLPDAFPADAYIARTEPLGACGGAIVSGSFQAFDQTYLVDALERLGPAYVGVTQLPATATDREILELDRRGVRALRFNLYRSESVRPEVVETLARRVHSLAGWHVELYAGPDDLAAIAPMLHTLPRIVIDHLGMSAAALPTLLDLVADGAYVKASGFGRVSVDVPTTLREIAAINPNALLFGTDLPSTRARVPFDRRDIDLVRTILGETIAGRVLYDNAVALYRPTLSPHLHLRGPAEP